MAVEDNPRFNEWKHISDELHRRRVHFEAIKTLPETHLLRRHCRKKLDEAQAAYEKCVSEQLAELVIVGQNRDGPGEGTNSEASSGSM